MEKDAVANRAKKRVQSMKSERMNWDSHWKELADYILPRKDDVFTKNNVIAGEKKTNKGFLFDTTAIHSNVLLASALHSMMTNPTLQWMELTTGEEELDKQDRVRLWLQDSTKRMHNLYNRTNFQTEIHEVYLDIASLGTASMTIEDDKEYDVRFRSYPIYHSYIDENEKGVVDTVAREFRWTISNIASKWGEDKLPKKFRDILKKKPDEKFTVVHIVCPASKAGQFGVTELKFGRKKWMSMYYIDEGPITLELEGLFDNPYVISRWSKISGEKYGRGPGTFSLPDIKMINAAKEVSLRGWQKTVDPPWLFPDQGISLPVDLRPGRVTYYRAGTKEDIKPLVSGARPDVNQQFLEIIGKQIREAFFIDQLQLNDGPQMTATEVSQRTEEKLRLLAPILARQQDELLTPIVDKTFNVMLKKEMFLPIPEELSGREVIGRYSSQIAKAQRVSEGQNILRMVEAAGPFFQMDPSIADNINTDEVLRYIARTYGAPQLIFRNQDEVEQLREQRAEAEAEARQREAALAEAEAVQKAGPTMLAASQQNEEG